MDENPAIDDDGFYGMCSSVIKISETSNKIDGEIGIGYGFDATGNRPWGIYRFIGEEKAEWCCESFLQWLNEVIDRNGRLLD